MIPLKRKLTVYQGRTFSQPVRWEAPDFVYVPLSAITKGAPCRITTTTPHGMPPDWRCAVVSAGGMTEINAETPPRAEQWRRGTVIDATTVEFNDLNSSGFSTYTSGGYLQFHAPVDLAGRTARMSIKDRQGTVLLSLTTENGRIAIDAANKVITLQISAADTAGFTWTSGVYDLEVLGPGDAIVALLTGTVTVVREITTGN